MKTLAHAALAFAFLGFAASSARSFTMMALPFEDLCDKSHRVVRAQCLESSRKVDPIKQRAYIYSTFRVIENIAGPATGDTITLRVISLGNRLMPPNAVPVFVSGDSYILFLTPPNDDGYPFLTGLGMGCYTLRNGVASQYMPVPAPPVQSGASGMTARRFIESAGDGAFTQMIRERKQ